jgi:hypothetical protein
MHYLRLELVEIYDYYYQKKEEDLSEIESFKLIYGVFVDADEQVD